MELDDNLIKITSPESQGTACLSFIQCMMCYKLERAALLTAPIAIAKCKIPQHFVLIKLAQHHWNVSRIGFTGITLLFISSESVQMARRIASHCCSFVHFKLTQINDRAAGQTKLAWLVLQNQNKPKIKHRACLVELASLY